MGPHPSILAKLCSAAIKSYSSAGVAMHRALPLHTKTDALGSLHVTSVMYSMDDCVRRSPA